MRADWEADFVDYARARSRGLRNTAYLLCGDWHLAEDLTQTALAKLYLAWRRIDRSGSVDGYARQTLVRAFLDEKRHRRWRAERSTGEPPELPGTERGYDGADDRSVLLGALATLSPTQRAAVVLRYWEDLPVAEAAVLLGLSEGGVKSACSRGLAALREVLQGSRCGEPATIEEENP